MSDIPDEEQHPDVELAWDALGHLQEIDAEKYPPRVSGLHDRAVEIVEDLAVEIQIEVGDE